MKQNFRVNVQKLEENKPNKKLIKTLQNKVDRISIITTDVMYNNGKEKKSDSQEKKN